MWKQFTSALGNVVEQVIGGGGPESKPREPLKKSDIKNTRKSILYFVRVAKDGTLTLTDEAIGIAGQNVQPETGTAEKVDKAEKSKSVDDKDDSDEKEPQKQNEKEKTTQPEKEKTTQPEKEKISQPEKEETADNESEQLIAYLRAVVKTIPEKDNPKEISDFNYHYVDGKLVNIDTGTPFHWVNQAHYDALGDTIVSHIQKIMVTDYKLNEVLLPLKSEEDPDYDGPYNDIYVSKDWDTCEKLMLLIQGSGAVRAGQWARALCINENLKIGTIFPYLDLCQKHGFGVIVFNPNLNSKPSKPVQIKRSKFLSTESSLPSHYGEIPIKGSESPGTHDLYVWDNFVRRAKAKIIAAVAHSAGGSGALQLVRKRGDEVAERLCGIAFTDSAHAVSRNDSPRVKKYIQTRCQNWVKSRAPLDTVLGTPKYDCCCLSAGHDKHEYTSGVAVNSVFDFLLDKAQKFSAAEKLDDDVDSDSDEDDEQPPRKSKSPQKPTEKDKTPQKEKSDDEKQPDKKNQSTPETGATSEKSDNTQGSPTPVQQTD